LFSSLPKKVVDLIVSINPALKGLHVHDRLSDRLHDRPNDRPHDRINNMPYDRLHDRLNDRLVQVIPSIKGRGSSEAVQSDGWCSRSQSEPMAVVEEYGTGEAG